MDTITLTINGTTVSGKTGMTILALAREMGISIPTLCHDPHLKDIGACRICLVEEENRKALLPACVTAIQPGMIIKTDSAPVLECRRIVVKLLLASHPESCLVCDKGNRCQLRQIASDLGVGLIDMDPMPQYFPSEDRNPFFKRDMSKCILCAKCIRGDQDLVVEGVLDYLNRGFEARPSTLFNQPLEKSNCTFCGTCISLCPTGALTEVGLPWPGTGREVSQTVCPLCACGCSVALESMDGRLIRVRPHGEGSSNGVTLCVKGHFGLDFIHSPDRLRTPLLREEGGWKEASWKEALELVASSLKAIKDKKKGEAIGFLGSSRLTNEENYLFQKLARSVFGSPHVDNGSRLYAAPAFKVLLDAMGRPGMLKSFSELGKADLFLVIGANPAETAPVLSYYLKRAIRDSGARLILIDPRKTPLSRFATLHLRPALGGDLSLIHGITRIMLQNGFWNKEFVHAHTDGFREWEENFTRGNLKLLTRQAGVGDEKLHEAARLLGEAAKVLCIFGDGVTQQPEGVALVRALSNLMILKGESEEWDVGILPLLKENNTLGAWGMGLVPEFLPGFVPSGANANQVPEKERLTALEMIQAADKGKLNALYIVGENPLISFPDRAWVERALARIPFLVVQDLYLTETANMARVVLPAASFAEKEGTVINLEGRIQKINKVFPPLGNSLPDGLIFRRLGEKLGQRIAPEEPTELWEEIGKKAPLYGGIPTHLLVRGEGRLSPGQVRPRFLLSGTDTPQKFLEKEEDFPFYFMTGAVRHHLGWGTRTSRSSRLKKLAPDPCVAISPEEGAALGLAEGDEIRIISRKGEIQSRIRFDPDLPRGLIFASHGYPSRGENRLLDHLWDEETKSQLQKGCAVRIERIDDEPDRDDAA
ncbi:MAG: molybdopterin-dependent oxidoreductase [Syntrophales bacterium]|nr:molybdopterin-dependent oxidoreductase [Syntrophales bacterium]